MYAIRSYYAYPFGSAAEMLAMGATSGRSIAEMKRANELTAVSAHALREGLDRVWDVMDSCIERGLRSEGELPGGLHVRRRAKAIRAQLEAERGRITSYNVCYTKLLRLPVST